MNVVHAYSDVGCAFAQFYGWSPLRVLGLTLALLALVAYVATLWAWLRRDVSAETQDDLPPRWRAG